MHREQTYDRRCRGAACWLFLLLPMLATFGLPSAGGSVAWAESATAEQDAPAEAAPAPSENSDGNVKENAESETDGEERGSAATQENSSDGQANEKPQEQSEEQGEANESDEPQAMKKSEAAASEAKSAGQEQASAETERPVEIEPPEQPAQQPDEKPQPKQNPPKKKCIIGATATLLEKQSELKFRARVDSGAKSCSLHVEKIKIEGESKQEDIVQRMTENIGKVIHFEVKNGDAKTHILTSKIAGYVIIKNSTNKDGKRRYKVPLTFRWKHMEKEVLVTLTDRQHMDYPLLLGRNFLRGDFLVDVEIDSDD